MLCLLLHPKPFSGFPPSLQSRPQPSKQATGKSRHRPYNFSCPNWIRLKMSSFNGRYRHCLGAK